MTNKLISIYSDGSSTGRSDGPGGWGFVLVVDNEVVGSGFGGEPITTNNRQEITGAIKGLEAALQYLQNRNEPHDIELVSDSKLVLGFASGSYNPSKNVDLATELRRICKTTSIKEYRWVRGHSGDPFNEHVDKLAKQGKAQFE
jgi:ribonuclease HI